MSVWYCDNCAKNLNCNSRMCPFSQLNLHLLDQMTWLANQLEYNIIFVRQRLQSIGIWVCCHRLWHKNLPPLNYASESALKQERFSPSILKISLACQTNPSLWPRVNLLDTPHPLQMLRVGALAHKNRKKEWNHRRKTNVSHFRMMNPPRLKQTCKITSLFVMELLTSRGLNLTVHSASP